MAPNEPKSAAGKRLWALHHWTGLYAGLFLALLSVTGTAALFKQEIDVALNPRLFVAATPAGASRGAAGLSELVQRYAAAQPDWSFHSALLPDRPDGSWQLRFRAKRGNWLDESVFWEVFVDPHTGLEQGRRDMYRTFAYFLRNLHVRFYEPYWGRQIVGLGGVALLVSTVTGLLIYGRFTRRQRFGTIRRGRGLRIVTADWHKLVGITTLAFNLMIAVTGGWLGLQPVLMKWAGAKAPNQAYQPVPVIAPAADRALPVDLPRVLAAAADTMAGFVPAMVVVSDGGERTVELLGSVPGTVYERLSQRVVVDKQTYAVRHAFDVRQQGAGTKIYYVQEALHFGDFGGIWLKVAYALLGLISGGLSVTGFVIYLKRTEKRRRTSGPNPAARATTPA